jgi:hypothetical protein
MPILKPQIAEALRESGLLKAQAQDLDDSLDQNGLSLNDVLSQLQFEMTNGETSASRVRASEIALKIRGLMKDQPSVGPSITIVINDSQPEKIGGFNPILVPRELSA